MHRKHKMLSLGLLLLLFAAVKLAVLWWWQQQQPAVTDIVCDIQAGCTLPDGGHIRFGSTLGIKSPFDIHYQGKAQQVSVSFSMRDMDMGFNRYELQPSDGGRSAQNVRLPLCTSARHDFLADIDADGRRYRIAFYAP